MTVRRSHWSESARLPSLRLAAGQAGPGRSGSYLPSESDRLHCWECAVLAVTQWPQHSRSRSKSPRRRQIAFFRPPAPTPRPPNTPRPRCPRSDPETRGAPAWECCSVGHRARRLVLGRGETSTEVKWHIASSRWGVCPTCPYFLVHWDTKILQGIMCHAFGIIEFKFFDSDTVLPRLTQLSLFGSLH